MAEYNPYDTLKDEKKTSVFWAGAIDNLPDPVRTTRWRLVIPQSIFELVGVEASNGDHFMNEGGSDEFALHVSEGMSVPEIDTEDKSIWYMGFEKYFPTKQNGLAGTQQIKGLLLEDIKAYEAMVAWNQTCLNTGILSDSPTNQMPDSTTSRNTNEGSNKIYLGLGQQENFGNQYAGLLRNAAVRMELYDWNYGNVLLSICYINCWPKKVKLDNTFNYQNADLGKFSVTFRYDRWNLYIPKRGYKVIGPPSAS